MEGSPTFSREGRPGDRAFEATAGPAAELQIEHQPCASGTRATRQESIASGTLFGTEEQIAVIRLPADDAHHARAADSLAAR